MCVECFMAFIVSYGVAFPSLVYWGLTPQPGSYQGGERPEREQILRYYLDSHFSPLLFYNFMEVLLLLNLATDIRSRFCYKYTTVFCYINCVPVADLRSRFCYKYYYI